jgi:hypothetical protein
MRCRRSYLAVPTRAGFLIVHVVLTRCLFVWAGGIRRRSILPASVWEESVFS